MSGFEVYGPPGGGSFGNVTGPGASSVGDVVTWTNSSGTTIGDAGFLASDVLLKTGGTMTGDLFLNADPTAPTQAATKAYVDASAGGATFKQFTIVGTTGNLNAIYNNGAAGVGATLTNNGALAAINIDGVPLVLNDRVLVKNQASMLENGIYEVTVVGSGILAWELARTTDYDSPAEITIGTVVPVQSGTVNANTSWIESAVVVAVGVDSIVFTQFTYNASTFLQVANNLSDLNNTATARQNLGVKIGVDVEAWSSELDAVAALATTGVVSRNAANTWSTSSITNHAVQIGNGTNGLTQLAVGATNTVLLGNTGADPSFGSVPNAALANSSVTLNSGNNITVTGGGPLSLGGVASFNVTGTTNHALQVGNAGGSLTSLALGSSGQVLQSTGAGSDPSYSTATYPSTTTINRILYSSANNTVSEITAANDGVLISGNTGIPSMLAAGTTGQVLTATTGSPPSWITPATTPTGSVTQYDVLVGGAANTIVSVGPGSAGQILQSGGAAANPAYSTPTYPSTSGTSGKILISDGTNNIYSTPTYPSTAGTSGNVLTSDGTNWVSSFPVFKVTTPGGYPYTATPTDGVILVDTSLARTINLNAAPATGQPYRIKDNTGSAGTNNITIVPAAGNIDGAASAKIESNYGSVDVVYTGAQWIQL